MRLFVINVNLDRLVVQALPYANMLLVALSAVAVTHGLGGEHTSWPWLVAAMCDFGCLLALNQRYGQIQGQKRASEDFLGMFKQLRYAALAGNQLSLNTGLALGSTGIYGGNIEPVAKDLDAALRRLMDEIEGVTPMVPKPQRESPEATEPVVTEAPPPFLSDKRTDAGIPEREL